MTRRLDRADLLKLAAAAAAAGALPATARAGNSAAFPGAHPSYRFVFVNHAITNPFFVPTWNGIDDACLMLGVTSQWTGSRSSNAEEMVRAMDRAIRERVSGIAVSLISRHSFNAPTARALALGIPVVAYNADGGVDNKRLAYIGQDLYESGLKFGARVASLVDSGDVYFFIATPGQQNIQPRVDGALDALRDSGRPIRTHVVATGAAVGAERQVIERTYRAHRKLRGMFAVDGGSTQGVADVMRAHGLNRRGVRAGGYDLLPRTLTAIRDGHLDFTIDQQPYLQGFLPVLQLFLYRFSGGLVAPVDSNTGVLFVTRRNVGPYLSRDTRFEGTA